MNMQLLLLVFLSFAEHFGPGPWAVFGYLVLTFVGQGPAGLWGSLGVLGVPGDAPGVWLSPHKTGSRSEPREPHS